MCWSKTPSHGDCSSWCSPANGLHSIVMWIAPQSPAFEQYIRGQVKLSSGKEDIMVIWWQNTHIIFSLWLIVDHVSWHNVEMIEHLMQCVLGVSKNFLLINCNCSVELHNFHNQNMCDSRYWLRSHKWLNSRRPDLRHSYALLILVWCHPCEEGTTTRSEYIICNNKNMFEY